jgi:hypothetical protein
MKRVLPDFLRAGSPRTARTAAGLLALALAAGCDSYNTPNLEPPAYYHPANVYRESLSLPASVKRVALLPLTSVGTDAALEAGVGAMAPVVDAELKKTERFEVITIPATQLRQLTGKSAWRADELLPMDFIRHLQRDTGCDAVMFCEVTRYQPYQPMAIGWKLCLVAQGVGEKAEARKLWSVDEVVDGGDTKVAKAARTYYSQHIHNEQPQSDTATILRSPALFGQFSLSALFATMPDRTRDWESR